MKVGDSLRLKTRNGSRILKITRIRIVDRYVEFKFEGMSDWWASGTYAGDNIPDKGFRYEKVYTFNDYANI